MKTCERAALDEGVGDATALGVELGVLVGDGLGSGATVLGLQAASRHSASAALRRDLTPPDTTIRGVVRLQGGPWEIEIRPERGGRISSLRLAGGEVLDQGIGNDDPAAEGFVAAGAWGWDDMVPNVEAARYPGPGPYSGIELPDHGEAWRLAWAVMGKTPSSAAMSCMGNVLPWRLHRRVQASHAGVRVTYVYKNEGLHPLYAYWCAHPLFRFEEGMEIGVEGGEHLAHLPEGTSRKTFLRRGSIARVRLAWVSGAAVEVAWDKAVTPYVGVWVCNGDLGGYRQVAIEPATGVGDRPHLAVPPPLLGPGEELRWWLEIRDAR